ncbi:MAG: hypothetical protein ACXABJ_05360 [Candidatus Heimdallarchaeaceae archaeon]|jgi:small subunit ribosomal protein S4e
MTKSGSKRHLKRFVVSKHIPVSKKEFTFTVKPSPGPHAADDCIPIAILLRDMFNYARNMSEIKRILYERNVVVDGRVKTNRKYPLGFMDVLSFPKINEHYRLIYLPKVGLRTVPITESEMNVKLYLVLGPEDSKSQSYYTHDTLKISIPDQKILESYELKIGNYGFVTSGRWMGMHGIIEEISSHGTKKTRTVTLTTSEGERLVTLYRYIFVIGAESPSVTIEGKKKKVKAHE